MRRFPSSWPALLLLAILHLLPGISAAVPSGGSGPLTAPAPAIPAPVPSAKAIPAEALSPDARFSRALSAYQAGAWEEARRQFLAIVEQGNLSAALAHNLGNTEFRRGQAGQAVLWYRRALVLQPFSPETLQNLRTLRRQNAFLSFDTWTLSLAYLKPHWVRNSLVLSAWGALIVLVWLVWLTPRPGRRWPLVTLFSLVLPVLGAAAALEWHLQRDPHPLRLRHLVSAEAATAYAAPAEASSTIISLPPGSEVVPLETRGNWKYCSIPGGTDQQPLRGWIRTVKLEPLWPYQGS